MVLKGLHILHCPVCGGTNVQLLAWIDANTNVWCCDINSHLEKEDTWCEDCEEHTGLATLRELWERFSEIKINDNGEIEEDFMFFKAGTSRINVWDWFDERCPNSLIDDLIKPNKLSQICQKDVFTK